MKILELNITEFGALKDKKISFSDGLNIIEGDNESGKSTLVLFIKFMLYGLGRKSAKNIDRERALSFDGHRASGSMKIEHCGAEYLIERRATSGAKSGDGVKLTNLNTGEIIEGEPGEVLLGVPCEVFESSAYVSQSKAATLGGAGTANAIENMLVSADESIDVSKILDRLDRVRKEYRLNRGEGGELYRMEQELISLKIKHREASDKQLNATEMEAKLGRLELNIKKVSESYKSSKQMLDDLTNASILKRFEELDKANNALDALRAQHTRLIQPMANQGFIPDRAHCAALKNSAMVYGEVTQKHGMRKYEAESLPPLDDNTLTMAEVGQQIESLGGKSEFSKEAIGYNKKSRTLKIISIAVLILGVLGSAVSFLFPLIALKIALPALTAISAVLCFIGGTRQKKKRDAICAQLGVPFPSLDAYADKCLAALSEHRADEAHKATANALYQAAKQDMESAEQALRSLLIKTLPNAEPTRLYELAEQEHTRLEAFCAQNEQLQRDIYAKEALVTTLKKELDIYDREALKSSVRTDISTLTPEAIERAKTHERFDRERLSMLANEEKALRESLIALRAGLNASPVELSDKISVLEKKLDDDTRFYNALMLAKEHIEKASTAMTTGVTPDIARRASEMMASVSGGAHQALQTTKSLSLSLEDNGFYISSELLSGGTRDAAYICLRIALMHRIYGENIPPLILDESLCQLDNVRTQRMLTLLSGLSQRMQCLLLTCHSREKELCEAKEISAKYIDFSGIM